MTNLPKVIEYFQKPSSYTHDVKEVKLIQTHISYVLIAGEYVYKIKKPVDFGFLNFSTLEKRKFFCNQELELNRRLCPSLYLNVVKITEKEGGFEFDGNGNIVEYAVRMSRMNEKDMMSNVIARGELNKNDIERIVDVLVPFYHSAFDESLKEFGSPESVSVNVLENFDQLQDFVGNGALHAEQLTKLKNYAEKFLADKSSFAKRVHEGKICNCHGDMYSANICLGEEIYIFDCIEFNERFRYSDIAADLAFLAMDLDFNGLFDLSKYFIERYVEASGDYGLYSMLDFYKCYRAVVRGKIALFTASDPAVDPGFAEQCIKQAGSYFELACTYVDN